MIVECVPNFSEGRRPEVIRQIVAAIEAVPGAYLLHVDSDWDHHRTVITFVGEPEAVAAGAFAGVQAAQELINLDQHDGVHPRIGATDVLPFVPLQGTTMQDCVQLAHAVGQRIGTELAIPVYLYAEAATRRERRNLADVRRGGYEGLRTIIAHDPQRSPDFGPARMGIAGATAVGARPVLIAYNVYLDTSDRGIAQAVARAIRWSSGGLPHVKALGLLVDGHAQVSMNLTDYRVTPLLPVWEAITHAAAQQGAQPIRSEIVGLVPSAALPPASEVVLRLDPGFEEQLLERRLQAVMSGTQGVAPMFAYGATPWTY